MTETIPFETRLEDIRANVVDIADFNERVVGAYNSGFAERGLAADDQSARSVVPAGTGALRDFSYIAPDIPEFVAANCVGCMDCVTQCPDTAILGKVAEPATLEARLDAIPDDSARQQMAAQWTVTNKYYTVLEKKALEGASSAFSSIRRSAKDAPNVWTPAATTTRSA
jgi:ferredoxin